MSFLEAIIIANIYVIIFNIFWMVVGMATNYRHDLIGNPKMMWSHAVVWPAIVFILWQPA